MPLTTDERLSAVETAVQEVKAAVEGLTSGQADAERRADERARAAAEAVAAEFKTANAAILGLSTTLNNVQNRVSQWAAGGSLVGAVILFIAVRALGL